MILGIDEVGRGPWAGPLVMGAVILGDAAIDGLTDSKKLTRKKRDALDAEIRDKAAAFGLGWVPAEEIDEVGLAKALQLACRRAVEAVDALGVAYDKIIIDGTINFLKDTSKSPYVSTLKKADLLIQAVSAASIIAKVARDNYMAEQDAVYAGYGFGGHVGYGTAAHIAAIEKLGVTPLHRLSFAPLQKYRTVSLPSSQISPKSARRSLDTGPTAGSAPYDVTRSVILPTTRQIGDASETVATNELVNRGHTIIERNWKTKYCEIDIISRKGDTLYFTEVKHRKNTQAGDGLAAITTKKLNQMKFAAKLYVQVNHLYTANLRLLAIATSGENPVIDAIVLVDD